MLHVGTGNDLIQYPETIQNFWLEELSCIAFGGGWLGDGGS